MQFGISKAEEAPPGSEHLDPLCVFDWEGKLGVLVAWGFREIVLQ
jgi:hypothetical protein